MQHFIKIIFTVLFIVYISSCKKKTQIVVEEREYSNDDIIAWFDVSISDNKYFKGLPSVYFSVNFPKTPPNSLSDYPAYVQMGPYILKQHPLILSYYTIADKNGIIPNISETNSFRDLDIAFNTFERNGYNFYNDKINLPDFLTSFQDTLIISRSNVTTFTIVNNSPVEYIASLNTSGAISRQLKSGLNEIKIYPSEEITSLGLNFYCKKHFAIKDKWYILSRNVTYRFNTKIVN